MKKLYIILALVVVSFLMLFAGDTIKILRIYHNGTFTAIPLANIESVNHSKNIVSSYIDTVDSTYNFPINEIDSVVVTEADIKEYKDNLKTIRDHIFESKEQLSVEQYQANLLIWLRGCDFVSKTTLSDLKDLIIIEFTNGLNLYINFVNLDDYSDINDNSMANARRVNPNDKYKQTHFDVSSVTDEEIVNPNILYIQGRSMPSREEEQEESNAAKEWEQLDSIHNFSPVNGTLIPNFKSIKFLYEKYSEYGLVIISQTHGGNQRSGRFQVEDDQAIDNILKKEGIDYLEYLRPLIKNEDRISMNLYVRGEKVGIPSSELYVYDINPKHIGRLLHNNIIYGSYCYSYDLYDKGIKGINNSTVYGYTTKIWYHYNNLKETPAKDSLISHINRFLNGYTYNDANWPKPYTVNNSLQVPQTNKPKVKQRYFSILTNDITLNNEIIGEIKGYKNLKKELKWILFAHEGPNKFTPKDNNVKRIEDAYKPDANGNFTISSDIVNQYPNHAFIVGFEYAGKVYYGKMKTKGLNLCPDDNHPHMIDLGLPSGTKWVCRNIGAQKPEEYGGYYAWGEIKEKDDYSQWEYKWGSLSNLKKYCTMSNHGTVDNLTTLEYSDDIAYLTSDGLWVMPTYDQLCELVNNCTSRLMKFNGVWGRTFTGPNGNTIFLPMAGYRNYTYEPEYDWADYWSSTLCKQFPANAYSLSFNNNMVGIACVLGVDYNFRDLGFSIRPVARQK